MHFEIRYLTEYRYDAPVTDNLNSLRVRPATTSTQRCDEFHTRIEPEATGQPPPRLLRHRGDRVRHPRRPRPPHDRRARTRRHLRSAGAARRQLAEPREPRPTSTRRASSSSPGRTSPPIAGLSRARSGARRRDAAARAGDALRAHPRPLRVPARSDLRRLAGVRPPGRRRGRLPGLRPPLAGAAAPPRDRGALRLGLSVGRSRGRRRRLAGGRHARLARGSASRRGRQGRAGLGRRRPDEPRG